MEKTNIRLNNRFLVFDSKKNKYYLTDEDVLEHWKQLDNKELKKFKVNDVTDKINKFLSENKIESNVNFIEITNEGTVTKEVKQINISKLGGGGG
jgi:hypothetical protein|tara:strand:- start:672 stop:956 length:285 start_codon:yes stop_codon:yes gene_type:complete